MPAFPGYTSPMPQNPWQNPMMQAGGPGGDPTVPGADPNAPTDPNASLAGELQALLQLGGGIYGLTQSAGLSSDANKVFGQSNPFGGYRPYYGNQLLQLMQDPSSVTKLPGYQFLLNQGTAAIDRSAAAPGGKGFGSGGEMAELEQFGQGLADQFYMQQVNLLSNLAGSQFGPTDPYNALRGMGGAASSLGGSIQGLSSAVPGTLNLINKLFPGQPAGDPTSYSTSPTPSAFGGGAPFYDPNTGGYPGQGPPDLGNTDWLSGTGLGGTPGGINDPSGGNVDLSGMFSGPRAAGGEAAAGTAPSWMSGKVGPAVGAAAGIGADIYGIYSGAKRGGVVGAGQVGIGGAKLGAQAGLFSPQANLYAGELGNVLGIYSGIKQGGAAGYGGAAVNAAQLGSRLGVFGSGVGTAAGYVAAPLALYNFAENWQSGKTGSDALQGAEAGAAIGSIVGPIGTIVGGVIGGAAGALSSAFGPGAKDPESATFANYVNTYAKNPAAVSQATAPQTFQSLAGLFDLRSGQISPNVPMYNQFGRMGENAFTASMMQKINSSISSGTVPKGASASQIYKQVVQPWMNSWGKGDLSKDPHGAAIANMVQQLISQWQSGTLTSRTPVGIDGETISNLPTYGGH